MKNKTILIVLSCLTVSIQAQPSQAMHSSSSGSSYRDFPTPGHWEATPNSSATGHGASSTMTPPLTAENWCRFFGADLPSSSNSLPPSIAATTGCSPTERESKRNEDEAVRAAEKKRIADAKVAKVMCFPGETLIAVKDESSNAYKAIPISAIRIGDTVINCNLSGNDGTCEFGQVREVFVRRTDLLIKLRFGENEIRTTPNHPFYSVEKKSFVKAKDLQLETEFLTLSGETAVLSQIAQENGDFEVYNLDVEGNHNYFACDLLVHNCNVAVAGTLATGARNMFAGAEIGGLAGGPFGAVAGGMIAGIAGLAIGEIFHQANINDSSSVGNPPIENDSHVIVSGPSESEQWKVLEPYRGKTKASGIGKDRRYYEWDRTHKDIEVYDRKGNHLGSMEPTTGELYKPAVPGRKIDL